MRQAAPFVGGFLLLVLLWAFWRPEATSFYEYLGWMGSASAAIFAAVSARATLATIQEMRRAHIAERRPDLTLDSGADYFTISWPDTTAAPRERAHPRYNCHWRDDEATKRRPPFLMLENFGGSAALDVSVTFECAGEGEAAPSIPAHYRSVPHGSSNRLSYDAAKGTLTFRTLGTSYIDMPKPSVSVFIPHCGPGTRRPVEIPRQVLWWLALRTLEEAPKRGFLAPPQRQTLNVVVHSRSAPEGERRDAYRFSVRCAVWPDAVNGAPRVIWEDHASGELRISLELSAEPRPQ